MATSSTSSALGAVDACSTDSSRSAEVCRSRCSNLLLTMQSQRNCESIYAEFARCGATLCHVRNICKSTCMSTRGAAEENLSSCQTGRTSTFEVPVEARISRCGLADGRVRRDRANRVWPRIRGATCLLQMGRCGGQRLGSAGRGARRANDDCHDVTLATGGLVASHRDALQLQGEGYDRIICIPTAWLPQRLLTTLHSHCRLLLAAQSSISTSGRATDTAEPTFVRFPALPVGVARLSGAWQEMTSHSVSTGCSGVRFLSYTAGRRQPRPGSADMVA